MMLCGIDGTANVAAKAVGFRFFRDSEGVEDQLRFKILLLHDWVGFSMHTVRGPMVRCLAFKRRRRGLAGATCL